MKIRPLKYRPQTGVCYNYEVTSGKWIEIYYDRILMNNIYIFKGIAESIRFISEDVWDVLYKQGRIRIA